MAPVPPPTADTPSPAPIIFTREDPASVQAMFSRIAGRYDVVNTLLSGGLDSFWRRRTAARVRAWKPARVLDLATGSGALGATLGRACPGAEIIGADFCLPLLRRARGRRGLAGLVAADGLRLPFADGAFDALSVGFGLRNMASWPEAVREMARVLRPGGHVAILDFSLPSRPGLRAAYRLYLHHVLPRIAAVACGERRAYDYLATSIERFPRGANMLALLEQCGFSDAVAEELTGGVVSLYTAKRAS